MRVLLCLLVLASYAPAQASDAVSVQLVWKHQFEFAAFYAAQELGYYRAVGLNVTIKEGGPGVDTVSDVVAGRADFALGTSSLVLERFHGQPVVALASLMQHSPIALLARQAPNITNVHDLANHPIAVDPHDRDEIDAFLLGAGIPAKQIRFVPETDWTLDSLHQGKIAAKAIYLSNEPFLIRGAEHEYLILTPRSVGIDLFGNILFTSESVVRQRPAVVEAFKRATLRGMVYSLEHPNEVTDLILRKYNTQNKSRAHLLYEADRIRELTRADIVEPGYMSAGRWHHVVSVYARLGKMPEDFKLEGFLYDPVPARVPAWMIWSLASSLLAMVLSWVIVVRIRRLNRLLKAEVADRKHAQEQLRESEQRVRLMTDNIRDYAIFMLNSHGRVATWNDGASRCKGYRSDEIVGESLSVFYPADDIQAGKADRLLALAKNEGIARDVGWRVRKDGSRYYADVVIEAIRNDVGALLGFVKIARDVTERYQAEQSLRENEAQISRIIDLMPEAVLVVDEHGRIVRLNEHTQRVFGYGAAELLGRPIELLIPERFRATHTGLRQHYLANPGLRPIGGGRELSARHRDGHDIPVEVALAPMKDRDKLFVVVVLSDITFRKAVETELMAHRQGLERMVADRTRELAEAKEAAETANAAKSVFLANMSHEIRSPIHAINGMAHIIRRQGLTPQQLLQMDKLQQAGKHLTDVIDDILDLSKIEAGKLELLERDVQLEELVADIKSILNERLHRKGLDFTVELPERAPLLRGDPTRLLQAVLNYATNAVKFTERGGIRLCVRFAEDDADHTTVRFEVHDTGIGISPGESSRLFAPFEQADNSSTRQYGGTGLGLAITKRLAQLMGGDVGMTSILGQGSTFWFTARLRKAAEPKAAASRVPGSVDSESILRQEYAGARILLVEDDAINQEIASSLLQDARQHVDVASNGIEAVAMASAAQYDVILMDMQMPRMNGLEATRAIRGLYENEGIPIIALTANAFEKDKAACLAAGMNDFISKPVDPDVMFAKLLMWLRRRAQSLPFTSIGASG